MRVPLGESVHPVIALVVALTSHHRIAGGLLDVAPFLVPGSPFA